MTQATQSISCVRFWITFLPKLVNEKQTRIHLAYLKNLSMPKLRDTEALVENRICSVSTDGGDRINP